MSHAATMPTLGMGKQRRVGCFSQLVVLISPEKIVEPTGNDNHWLFRAGFPGSHTVIVGESIEPGHFRVHSQPTHRIKFQAGITANSRQPNLTATLSP